ncbi:hypothetical protein [Streptomyces sp. enrichment culture]|uniref:hypothetical protein n=1 Tax=Streptomyces sp. enrichment culture TaxID=1795815 RepID=UPI003F552BE6
MQRAGWATSLRGMAVAGSAMVLTLTGATAASAFGGSASPASAPGKSDSTWARQDAPAERSAATPGGYRGTQGFNLCLLSRCSVGSGGGAGGGIGLVQGGNLCLLSFCDVRP